MQKVLILILILIFIISCTTQNLRYDSELTQMNYPFEVKTFNLKSQTQNLKMRYMDINIKGKKAVVLLHGKNFAGFYWRRVANNLVSKNYRVIIPDQIGFGKSTKPQSYQFSMAQFALNTNNLLLSLNIKKARIVGHSMGGMIASTYAYLYPKQVMDLTLINPIGLDNYLDTVEFKDPEFFYNIEKSKTIDQIRKYQVKNYYDGKWSDEYEELLLPFKGWLNGGDWPLVAWNNALTYGPIFTKDITSKFKKIKTKTYLIIGTRDLTGPGRGWKREGVNTKLGQYDKLGKLTNSRLKNSTLFELEGLGHMPQFENYDKFNKVFNKIFK